MIHEVLIILQDFIPQDWLEKIHQKVIKSRRTYFMMHFPDLVSTRCELITSFIHSPTQSGRSMCNKIPKYMVNKKNMFGWL